MIKFYKSDLEVHLDETGKNLNLSTIGPAFFDILSVYSMSEQSHCVDFRHIIIPNYLSYLGEPLHLHIDCREKLKRCIATFFDILNIPFFFYKEIGLSEFKIFLASWSFCPGGTAIGQTVNFFCRYPFFEIFSVPGTQRYLISEIFSVLGTQWYPRFFNFVGYQGTAHADPWF